MVPLVEQYYNALTRDAGAANLLTWEAEIKAAELKRVDDQTKMDIMASRMPGKKSAGQDEESADTYGRRNWIDLGLEIEEKQYVQFDVSVRRVSHRVTKHILGGQYGTVFGGVEKH